MMRGWPVLVVAAFATHAAANPPAPSVARGKQLFLQCSACHSLEGKPSLGPDLRGVVGRKAAARVDYRYSAAMAKSAVTWDPVTLDAFLANPQQFMRGTRMPYAGMKDARDRADLISFLQSNR